MLTRRNFVLASTLIPLAARAGDNPAGLIAAIEKRAGGRLGVAALDTGSGRRIRWRADERFAMCSTFKLLLAGAVLNRITVGLERTVNRLDYTRADLLDYAPVARKHLGPDGKGSMSFEEMIEAVLVYSDNTAANLLLAYLGGPARLTFYASWLGDDVTRLDRNEPGLNTAIPGDPRDTTTPAAMLKDMKRLLVDRNDRYSERAPLIELMLACKTADSRIRAGLPKGWKSGNKTGTGENGSTNDLAILFPPHGRAPILVAAYYTGSKAELAAREKVLAAVGRIVSAIL
jgi:beta-lactamase class A